MGQGEDRESTIEEIVKNRVKIMKMINILFVMIDKFFFIVLFNFLFIIRNPP